MAYFKYSVGEKIKLACCAVVATGALIFGGAKLYSIGNIPPQYRETSALVVNAEPETIEGPSISEATLDSMLSHQAASGYSRMKKQQVEEGKAIASDVVKQKAEMLDIALDISPLQLEALHC